MDKSFWGRFARIVLLAASHIKYFRRHKKPGEDHGFWGEAEVRRKFERNEEGVCAGEGK